MCAGFFASGTAQASLLDRGNGLLYDDVLNVTWLNDANYAKTSGYDVDGRMNWAAANTWAANLVYGGFSDWRLAANTPVGANWKYASAGTEYNSGNFDTGYNISSSHSEMSYMYYVNLGLTGKFSTQGLQQYDWGIFGDGSYFIAGRENAVGPIIHLQSSVYWSGTALAIAPTTYSFYFNYYEGNQLVSYQSSEQYAWAVRDGDVSAAAIPEPGTLILLILSLSGLAASRKSRKAS